jgi:hypothetical protein
LDEPDDNGDVYIANKADSIAELNIVVEVDVDIDIASISMVVEVVVDISRSKLHSDSTFFFVITDNHKNKYLFRNKKQFLKNC